MKAYLDKLDLCFEDVKYKGGFYRSDELIHLLAKTYRREWDESVFTGNGLTGITVYKAAPQKTMWEMGRNDVTAHNFLEGIDWAIPRVPIGNLVLEVQEPIISESMRIHLYDACISGEITTESGSIQYVSYVPRDNHGIYIKIEGDEAVHYSLNVQPRHGISDRIYYSGKKVDKALLPPEPYINCCGEIIQSIQEFVAADEKDVKPEGACVLSWTQKKIEKGIEFYISIQNENDREEAKAKSYQDVVGFFANKEAILASHGNWWKEYYGKSCVYLSDEKWNKFYWIQMYKLGCSIREDGVVLDSQGPFMTHTTWPTTVWNLNVELSYSSVFTSNHVELANSLISVLMKNKQVLIDNAKPMGIEDGMYLSRATSPTNLAAQWPDTYEMGNLLWTLFTVDRKERIVGDETLVRELLFPYLKMAINACRTLMEEDEDGILHIKDTSSPEYPSVKGVNWYPIYDCTYTIALLKWAVKRILELGAEYEIKDELQPVWEHINDHLVSYPVDENGYRVGRDIPFDISHRHFSHLMMIFPLATMDFQDEEACKLAIHSIEHWLSLEKRVQGYTFTGAATMMGYLKNGDKALEYLNGLDAFLSPNTMYSEFSPVIETPLSAAESIHAMLLQCHQGIVEPLPAVPSTWNEVKYNNLMADGGFLVSAEKVDGEVKEVTIESLRGKKLYVKLPVEMKCDKPEKVVVNQKGYLEVDIEKDEVIRFY